MKLFCAEKFSFKTVRCQEHVCFESEKHEGKHICRTCGLKWLTVPTGTDVPMDKNGEGVVQEQIVVPRIVNPWEN